VAGISPHEIDGFASYSDDPHDAVRLATLGHSGIASLKHAMGWRWRRDGGSCRSCRRGDCRRLADLRRRIRALAQGQFAWYGQGGMAFGYGSAARELPRDGFPGPARRDIAGPNDFHEGADALWIGHGVEQAAVSVVASTRF